MKHRSEVFTDALVGLAFAVVVIVALTWVGNVQASRYRQVVSRIDHNAQAIVCILRIQPQDRTSARVDGCLAAFGIAPGRP